MPACIQSSTATRAICVKAFALSLFFVSAVLLGTQHASAQVTRLAKLPRAADPLARHGGDPSQVFDGLADSHRATSQKLAPEEPSASSHALNITTFDVPFLDAVDTFPIAVNQAGTIVGMYYDGNSVSHGFVRSPNGTFTKFDAPGAGTTPNDFNGTFATGINKFGTIVGYYNDDNLVSHCLIRTADGNLTTFDVPGADTNPADEEGSTITGINSRGMTSGYYGDSNFLAHGFLRSPDGNFTSFDAPGAAGPGGPPPVFAGTFPESLNIQGAIAGFYTDANLLFHSFVRNADGTIATFLGPGECDTSLAGCFGGADLNINAGGLSVGNYQDMNNNIVAFLRSRTGRIVTFQAPGAGTGPSQGTGAYIYTGQTGGLNDSGAATATYLDANNVFHGYLRRPDGRFITFDAPGADLTPDDFNGTFPNSISDLGVITGWYWDSNFVAHGFVFRARP